MVAQDHANRYVCLLTRTNLSPYTLERAVAILFFAPVAELGKKGDGLDLDVKCKSVRRGLEVKRY